MNIFKKDFVFNVEGQRLTLEIDSELPNLVHTYKYRPEQRYKNGLMTIYNRIEFEEFQNDVQFMFIQFEKPVPQGTDRIQYTLSEIIKVHIKKFGRLIINDLYTFLDELTLILERLEELKGKKLSSEMGNEVWEHYCDLLMQIFKTNIWVPKPMQPNTLVKLSDL